MKNINYQKGIRRLFSCLFIIPSIIGFCIGWGNGEIYKYNPVNDSMYTLCIPKAILYGLLYFFIAYTVLLTVYYIVECLVIWIINGFCNNDFKYQLSCGEIFISVFYLIIFAIISIFIIPNWNNIVATTTKIFHYILIAVLGYGFIFGSFYGCKYLKKKIKAYSRLLRFRKIRKNKNKNDDFMNKSIYK